MLTRRFVDLSSNNAGFEAKAYARKRVLVAIKVSQGTTYIDPRWAGWAKNAHAQRVAVMHYHFADGGAGPEGEAQARYFLSHLKAGPYQHRCDRICLDIEQASACTDPVAFREGFEKVCVAQGHDSLVVYSDAGFLAQYGDGLRPRSGKLWVAAYPSLPAGWWGSKPFAHQYTEAATVEGVIGACDQSYLKVSSYLWQRTHRPKG